MTRIVKDTEKAKLRERRKRGSRKYGQAKLKASRRGVTSLALAAVIFVAVLSMLLMAYTSKGEAAGYIGGLGMTAAVCSVAGLAMAIRGFKERDRSYLSCKAGIVLHILFIVGLTAIFFRGLL